MSEAYLSLGSNIGDREAYLRAAVRIIKANSSIEISKISGVYETEAVGHTPQRRFLNIVVEVKTSLAPVGLLGICQFIEEFLKRTRKVKWGPRTIDVDILLYGQEDIKQPGLIIPHPEMAKRAFVLVPLLEIAPQITFPGGKEVSKCLDSISLTGVDRIGNLELGSGLHS